VIEGKLEGRIEMKGRRGRRRKQLLDDLKEMKRYWKLKEEALDRTLWRARFGRGYGPVVRQTTECMNECGDYCRLERSAFIIVKKYYQGHKGSKMEYTFYQKIKYKHPQKRN
jgi:hypothetical protein